MTFAVVLFIVALALIASEKVHRTKVALGAAALAILFISGFDQETAIEAIDFNTIGLLAGMMLLVHLTQESGVYDYIAIKAGQFSKGRPFWVVMSLAGTTAVLSAFLDNLTTILLVVPITFLLADALDIRPIPLIIIEVIASNIGGTATLIGDPPNIIIGGATGLSFNAFLINLGPVVVVTFFAVIPLLYFFFKRQLQVAPEARDHVMSLSARDAINDWSELKRTVPVLGLTVVGFFLHNVLHIEVATVALTGAAVALIVTRQDLEYSLSKIEWPTLFFFMALFIMVGSLEEVGAIDKIAEGMKEVTQGNRSAELLGILVVSGIGSGLVDNIPFTATMLPIVEQLNPGSDPIGDEAYWWALALGACFGGNATAIAAAANVAALGLTERAGKPISFLQFTKVGLPVSLVTLVIAAGYVTLRYIWLQ
ncbi:MAG: SLC13 family permease [Solirubrobacterales bacterium]